MLNHYLCYGDNDSPSRCGWGTVPPAPVLVPGQMMVRRFLSTKSTAELVGQKKRFVGDPVVFFPPNRETGAPSPERGGLNSQEKSMRGGRASGISVPRHFDHKPIFKQKFVKLTTLYPSRAGRGNNSIQDNEGIYRPLHPRQCWAAKIQRALEGTAQLKGDPKCTENECPTRGFVTAGMP